MTPWVQCECCEDFVCNIHQLHVFQCPCPPIDEWVEADHDPYLSEITPELKEWVNNNEMEDDECC